MNDNDKFSITICKNWLQSSYFIYIAEIVFRKKIYLYIGQTGDNNYRVARAPLYRIAGHFAKGTSTQNQIVKYFKKTILNVIKINNAKLEKALLEADIKYTFWKIDKFVTLNKKIHHNCLMKAQFIEQYLVHHLQKKSSIKVLNKKVKNEISASKIKYLKNKIEDYKVISKKILEELVYA